MCCWHCRHAFLFRSIYTRPAATSKTWPRPRDSGLEFRVLASVSAMSFCPRLTSLLNSKCIKLRERGKFFYMICHPDLQLRRHGAEFLAEMLTRDVCDQPPPVWPHLFRGAVMRKGGKNTWSGPWHLGCTSEVFHVHTYTRTSSFIQPGWAECVFIFSLGLYFLCLFCFNNNNNNNTSICKTHNVSIRAESEAPAVARWKGWLEG